MTGCDNHTFVACALQAPKHRETRENAQVINRHCFAPPLYMRETGGICEIVLSTRKRCNFGA